MDILNGDSFLIGYPICRTKMVAVVEIKTAHCGCCNEQKQRKQYRFYFFHSPYKLNHYLLLDFDYQISDIAHEMKHAYQFETGDLSFDSHTGGYGVLYDVTDERAAYDRSAALGGQIVNDATISRQRTKNGNGGCDYPFIMRDQAQWPDVGQERITNRNVNSKVSLINNVYRKNGKTIVR